MLPRTKEQEIDAKLLKRHRANVFHDSTNTKKNVAASEPFHKEAPPIETAAHTQPQQLNQKHERQQQITQGKSGKGLKYPDSATPKIDNRNKNKLKRHDDANFVDDAYTQQQLLKTSKSHLFTENNIVAKKSSQKNSKEKARLNKNDSTLLQSEIERGKARTSDFEEIQQGTSSQKRTDTTSQAMNKKRDHKETPSTIETREPKNKDEVKQVARVKIQVSSKVDPRQEDEISFENILRGPHQRALQRAIHSKVDNVPLLKAMLESCRPVEDSESFHHMKYDDEEDKKSTNLVSLSTAFGVKMIDTSKSSESLDGSDLTLMSSDEDYEEQLELPPGWKQIMSRSKNKPYYVHPDHGRTWYCPALIRRRKRRKVKSITTPERSSGNKKIMLSAHAETNLSSCIRENIPMVTERKIQNEMDKSMEESHSYEPEVEESAYNIQEFMVESKSYEHEHGSEESTHPRVNQDNKKIKPSAHQLNSDDQLNFTERTLAKGDKDNSSILSRNDEYGEQSRDDSSPALQSYPYRLKDARVSNRGNKFELHESIGDSTDDQSSSIIEHTEQFKPILASTDNSYFDDNVFDINPANDSPMIGDDCSHNDFQADDDSQQVLDSSASSEEGQLGDHSFEMDDDDSSRWISYPDIPRCSLQYLHKIIHA